MLVLLASLIVVYLRLGIQKTPVSRGRAVGGPRAF